MAYAGYGYPMHGYNDYGGYHGRATPTYHQRDYHDWDRYDDRYGGHYSSYSRHGGDERSYDPYADWDTHSAHSGHSGHSDHSVRSDGSYRNYDSYNRGGGYNHNYSYDDYYSHSRSPARTHHQQYYDHHDHRSPARHSDRSSERRPDDARSEVSSVRSADFRDPHDDDTKSVISTGTLKSVITVGSRATDGHRLTRKERRERKMGLKKGKLGKPKKSSRPRAVSSMADRDDPVHYVPPFPIFIHPTLLKKRIHNIMTKQLPKGQRARLTKAEANYLRYEVVSKGWLGYIDDVEYHFDTDARVIHVNSSSRVGLNDGGSNKKRVHHVWHQLKVSMKPEDKPVKRRREREPRRESREENREDRGRDWGDRDRDRTRESREDERDRSHRDHHDRDRRDDRDRREDRYRREDSRERRDDRWGSDRDTRERRDRYDRHRDY